MERITSATSTCRWDSVIRLFARIRLDNSALIPWSLFFLFGRKTSENHVLPPCAVKTVWQSCPLLGTVPSTERHLINVCHVNTWMVDWLIDEFITRKIIGCSRSPITSSTLILANRMRLSGCQNKRRPPSLLTYATWKQTTQVLESGRWLPCSSSHPKSLQVYPR